MESTGNPAEALDRLKELAKRNRYKDFPTRHRSLDRERRPVKRLIRLHHRLMSNRSARSFPLAARIELAGRIEPVAHTAARD